MADIKNLRDFYAKMKSDGLRLQNQFQISITGDDSGITDLQDLTFFADGSTLPEKTIGTNAVNFQAMKFTLPANVSYSGTISLNVKCDAAMKLHKAIEKWANVYSDIRNSGGGNKKLPNNLVRLDLLDEKLTTITKTYILVGVFTTGPGAVTFSNETPGVCTFPLNLAYQYWYDEADGDPLK